MPCCKNRTLLLTQPTQVLKKNFFSLSLFFYSKANFVSFSCSFFFQLWRKHLKNRWSAGLSIVHKKKRNFRKYHKCISKFGITYSYMGY